MCFRNIPHSSLFFWTVVDMADIYVAAMIGGNNDNVPGVRRVLPPFPFVGVSWRGFPKLPAFLCDQ